MVKWQGWAFQAQPFVIIEVELCKFCGMAEGKVAITGKPPARRGQGDANIWRATSSTGVNLTP